MMNLRLFLTSLLSGLRVVAAHVSARGRARSVEVPVPWGHLDHLFACFERLYTDWRNGILPEPCARADLQGAGVVRLSRRSARVLPDTAMALPPSQEPPAPAPASARPLLPGPTKSRPIAPRTGEAITPQKFPSRLSPPCHAHFIPY